MVHAVRIKDGKAQYCNRYMQTPKLEKERSYGYATEIRIGEINAGRCGIFKVLFMTLQEWLDYHLTPGGHPMKNGTANTALTNHAQKTFALMEGNFPFEIQI